MTPAQWDRIRPILERFRHEDGAPMPMVKDVLRTFGLSLSKQEARHLESITPPTRVRAGRFDPWRGKP